MSLVRHTLTDAPAFIAQLEAIVTHATRHAPATVFVVRIDHWFGDKWVGFGGKYLGLLGVRFRSHLPLPPFVPSRVVEQVCYRFSTEADGYVRDEKAAPLHVRQTSSANFRRLVDDLFPDAVFVWFSDKSAETGRGSVMIYVPTPEGHVAWYAGFSAERSWGPTRLVGITSADFAVGQPV